ncbi:nuclear transport factor 2 family protein [uncultured Methylophaga sp.]|uniref:nuclear transport factor 2 family protein n=1 Tax=Methylophaga sp. UBA2689 TaxID=1946878 RepID=UPI0030DC4037
MLNSKNKWKKAVISQNLEQIMACYAEDVRAFEAIAELQFTNRRRYQDHWQQYLDMCMMTKFKIGQLDINLDDDLAACAFLNQCCRLY